MRQKLIVRIPEKYKMQYYHQLKESNLKHIIILGLVILVVQFGTYIYELIFPFTEDTGLIETYYLYYKVTLIVDMFFITILIISVKKLGMSNRFTTIMMVFYLFLIHKWAMSTAVFDQFQGEGVTIYFFSMFFIVILVDLSLGQMVILFGSGYLTFVLLLNNYSDEIADTTEVISATGQFILFSLVIGHYIHELRKKNFLQNQTLTEMNKDLEYLSYYDSLSGLYNRRKWELEYYLMYKEAVEKGNLLGVIIIDIDHFKQYNDTYGHVEGDQVIRKVSEILHNIMDGENANIGRYGGDEFVVSVYDMDNESIIKCISKIKESIELKKILNENSAFSKYLTLSIGWKNIIPEPNDKEWDLVSYADGDLYMQKKHRKLKNIN